MRDWLDLFEGEAPSDELLDLLRTWMDDFNAEHTWNGGNNHVAEKIIALAKDHPPRLTGYLYRGTGIPDAAAAALHAGETVTIQPTQKLLTSWTTDPKIARDFCDIAADSHNYSSVTIRMPVERLDPIVDMRLLYDADINTGHEAEVLVRAEPLVLTPNDVLDIYLYDEQRGSCVHVKQ